MKNKTMVARGTEVLFVLVAALMIVIVYSLPALADTESVRHIGIKTSLQLQNIQHVQLLDPALVHISDVSGQDAGSQDGSKSKGKIRVPVLRHIGSVNDPTHKRVIVHIPNTSITHETTSTRGSLETTTPARSSQTTETRVPHKGAGTPTLPFTGGNGTPFAIGGLLIALAGVAIFASKRHLFSR